MENFLALFNEGMDEEASRLEKLLPFHEHPLIPFTRFEFTKCKGCYSTDEDNTSFISKHPGCSYIYGGHRCNEPGCDVVFHEECAKPLPEIDHPYHPVHPLKLILLHTRVSNCSFCGEFFSVGYRCNKCDFQLDLICARRPALLVLAENSYLHEHPLQLSHEAHETLRDCKGCGHQHNSWKHFYTCHQCEFFISLDCIDHNSPEAYHTSHPQHPLKSLRYEVPGYADKKCLLCREEFDGIHRQLHHCGVCNFSICRSCMKNPPPVLVKSPRTHEHQLHLVPRRIDFTCNACGTLGDRSPYFCLQCNFMIHRECIDLPRVININRHDHRISYTPRLGHGDGKCRVCRKNVDGFYGAYSCSKCFDYFVHSRCATRRDVWDMIELEGTPEEEETAPFKVIDDNTIDHYGHKHNLRIYRGWNLPESVVCTACVFQICSEPFYACARKRCDFIIHEKCAKLPLKKRHVCHNQPLELSPNYGTYLLHRCSICRQLFTGFSYESKELRIDVRCATVTEPFEHKSHQHPLHYSTDHSKRCSECDGDGKLSCDDCEFGLCFKCAILPQKVMRHRYDDHPLFLSYGEMGVAGKYWCEACETTVNPEKWFYTCNECGITLHISCVIDTYAYSMPGALTWIGTFVSNHSICRPLCCVCNSRCKLPFVRTLPEDGADLYFCSLECEKKIDQERFEF
ncbi:putative chromatin regulator PHD family [Arabidopsis thaliana]